MTRAVVLLAAWALGACAHGESSLAQFTSAHQSAEILPVEFVKQREPADCGAAALTSVSRFWGVDLAPGSIITHWAPADRASGYSIRELHDASAKLGLTSSRLLEEPDYVLKVVDQGMPVIAPIAKPFERRDIFDFMLASMASRLIVEAFLGGPSTANHYVVVLGSDDERVYFLDPQDGYRAIPRKDFLAQWSGLTLKFVPGAGANVAAFVAYRQEQAVVSESAPVIAFAEAAPLIADDDPPGFVEEFVGVDFDANGLAAGVAF